MMLKRVIQNFSKIKSFNYIGVMNTYLSLKKPPYLMVYFVAKWNPACKMADEDVKYVSEKYP